MFLEIGFCFCLVPLKFESHAIPHTLSSGSSMLLILQNYYSKEFYRTQGILRGSRKEHRRIGVY
jgi:hypothetical protein